MCRRRIANPASAPPASVPITEIGAYPQSELPLPAIGSTAWAMREPRSRAGFMLVPVGPASARISPQTKAAIKTGPKPAGRLARVRMQTATNTNSVVGIISLIRLVTLLGIDGWLQKQPSFNVGFGVAAQCGRKWSQTRTDPANAPNI